MKIPTKKHPFTVAAKLGFWRGWWITMFHHKFLKLKPVGFCKDRVTWVTGPHNWWNRTFSGHLWVHEPWRLATNQVFKRSFSYMILTNGGMMQVSQTSVFSVENGGFLVGENPIFFTWANHNYLIHPWCQIRSEILRPSWCHQLEETMGQSIGGWIRKRQWG